MGDVFDQLPEVKGQFIQFEKVGDNFKGTLIGVRHNVPGKFGDQTIYDFKAPDDSLWMYGTRNKFFIDQMKNIRPGQLVKLEFTEERDTGKVNKAHIITPFANPKFVDEEWIQQQEALKGLEDGRDQGPAPEGTTEGTAEEGDNVEVDEDSIPFVSPEEVEGYIKTISELAEKKLGVTDPNEVKKKVMIETGLAFNDDNLPEIVKKLEAMADAK